MVGPPCEENGHLAFVSLGGNTRGQASVTSSTASSHNHVGRSQLRVRAVRRPRNLQHLERKWFSSFVFVNEVWEHVADNVRFAEGMFQIFKEITVCHKCLLSNVALKHLRSSGFHRTGAVMFHKN